MKVTTLLLSAALAMSPALTLAQTNHTPPTPAQMAERQVTRYTALLTLTTAQQEQALTIFTTEATATSALRSTEHTDHQNLEAAIIADNTATIQQLATALGDLSAQNTLARSTAAAAFYKILTPDQQTRVAALEKAHAFEGGHGGPPSH